VGSVLILFSLYSLKRPQFAPLRAGKTADGVIGVLNGVIGGATGLAGIVITIWCTLRGWPRDEQRTVFQPIGVAVFLMTGIWLGGTGLVDFETLRLFVIGLPLLLAGTWVGLRLYARFSKGGPGSAADLGAWPGYARELSNARYRSLGTKSAVGGGSGPVARGRLGHTPRGHTIVVEICGASNISTRLHIQRMSWYFRPNGVSSHPAPKDGGPSKRCRHLSQSARGGPACASRDPTQISPGLGRASHPDASSSPCRHAETGASAGPSGEKR